MENNSKRFSSLEECSSPEDMKISYELAKSPSRVLMEHKPPCLDMFNTLRYDSKVKGTCEKCANIELWYEDRYYAEILQLQDFGFQDFISNLGGFIGIFLGYSMMQIPELFGTYYQHYSNFK